MPLETAQLLCTALQCNKVDAPYRPTHINHPCSIWVRESRSNFLYLADLGLSLCDEYTYRYGKVHVCQRVIQRCIPSAFALPDGPLTPFVQAMPEEYKKSDAIEAYQAYYLGDKRHLASWTRRETPPWWILNTNGQ
jgi:hypothetical protein